MRRKMSFVLIAALFLSCMCIVQSPKQKVSAAPLPCDGKAYMVRATPTGAGSTYSELYEFKQTGTTISLNDMHNAPTGLTYGGSPVNDLTAFPNGFLLNALAYNPVDGYMYAALNHVPGGSPNEILRIHDDGHLELVATVNLTSQNLKGATFSTTGTYYALTTNGTLYAVNGLDTATTAAPAAPATTLSISPTVPMGDLVYDMKNNELYAVDNDTMRVSSINTTTGVTTPISPSVTQDPDVLIDPAVTNGIGSAFITSTGELRAYINQSTSTSGQLVKIDLTTNHVSLIMDGPKTNDSDGTACNNPAYSIDTIKSVGAVTANSATSFSFPYIVQVVNKGTVPDPNVQLVDNLALTFASGTPTISVSNYAKTAGPCTIDPAFNGGSHLAMLTGTDTLNPAASCTMAFTVTLNYAQTSDVPTTPQLNTVLASAVSGTTPNPGHTYSGNEPIEPLNQLAVDTSNDSNTLPSAANGDPETPTPVTLTQPVYVLDIIKSAGAVETVNSTKYNVNYSLTLGNTGQVTVPNVQMNDNLRNTFTSGNPTITVNSLTKDAGPCTTNGSFNGQADTKLLTGTDQLASGEKCTLALKITVEYPSATDVPTAPQDNIAFASGTPSGPNPGHTYSGNTVTPPANALTIDQSTDGTAMPNTPHGDTPSPTPVTFGHLANTGVDITVVLMATSGVIVTAITALGVRRQLSRR